MRLRLRGARSSCSSSACARAPAAPCRDRPEAINPAAPPSGACAAPPGRTVHPETRRGGAVVVDVLGHAKDSLWSVDLFRCESAVLRAYWVLVEMDHYTRRIVGSGVHRGAVDGVGLCRMFNRATRGQRSAVFIIDTNAARSRCHLLRPEPRGSAKHSRQRRPPARRPRTSSRNQLLP
jgi:hypothetical protein